MSNTIHLPIKREWFDMILIGEKKEEYREVKPYWAKRICANVHTHTEFVCKPYREKGATMPFRMELPIKEGKTTLTLTAGYGKEKPRMVVELTGLEIKSPNPAWCPPGTEGLLFALKLGEVLETHNLPVLAVR